MANIYNFGLAGVGSQVQFGKGGTQLLSNSGTFSAVAADGSTLVRFQIADPVGNHDAVSLETLTTYNTAVTAAINLVQSNLTANVNSLTTLINTNEANTVSNAAALAGAIANSGMNFANAIAQVNANVIANVANLVSTISTNLATEKTDITSTNANLAANVTTLTTAINLVQSNVTANVAQIYTDLTSNVATLNSTITTNLNTEKTDITSTNANLAANVTTLTTAINLVQSNVTANVNQIYTDLTSNVTTLTNLINTNEANTVANAQSLANAIAASGSGWANAVATVNANVIANVNTLTTALNGLNANVIDNVSILTTSINTNYATERADIAATNANLAANVANLVSTLTTNLNTEKTDIAATNANLAANVSTLTTAINLVQSNVSANVASLYSALGSNVATLISDIAQVNSNVISNFNTEQADVAALAANLGSNVINLTTLINEVQSNATNSTATMYTALGATNANVAAEILRAEAAETVLTNAVTTINQHMVTKEGTVPFIGNVSMGGFAIQNVANPVNHGDAVNFQTLSTAIAALGHGFNYVGVLSTAGATSGTAASLSALTGPVGAPLAAGDYWKTTVAGWYTYNSVTFFVQANDGIVFNTTGGFDQLAHVDSQVFGSPGQIDVTGSVDVGFTVSIDSVFVGYVTTLQGNVIQLANAITAETQRAVAAESSLNTNVINEVSRATTAESTLNSNVVGEISRAIAAESQLNSNIITNYNTFVANASTLNNAITAEVSRATTAETTLTTNLNAEISRAGTAEGNIAANVATIEASVGLNTDGTYNHPVGSHYLDATTTVMGALIALDTAANTGSNAVAIETARAIAAEGVLNSNIISNVSTLTTALNGLNANVISNATIINGNVATMNSTLTTAINLVQSNVTANVAQIYTDLTSNVATLNSTINTVQSNATSNATVLSNVIHNIEVSAGISTVDGTFLSFTGTNYINGSTSLANALVLLDAAGNSGLANAVSTLNNTINTVQSNVTSNVVTLTNAINLVQSNVSANVASLTTLINTNEANTVANAQALATVIGIIENSVGLASTGSYVAPTGTNFVNGSVSVSNAIVLLDNAIESVVNTVAHLTQYQIITSDSKAYVRVDDANGVTTALDIAGAAQVVANVIGGSATNTILTTDFTVANAISLTAGGAATNVSIYLEPKGTGQVVIGQAGTPGMIQAEPGQSLELAGGDNGSGAGGSLVLRGGLGTSTSGNVTIEDASGNDVAVFSGVTGTNSNFNFLNGANAVTLGVTSNATSANIVLTPKGAGAVSVSGANVQNVANAIANTDAVNLGQMNTAISTAVVAAQTGVVYTAAVAINETTGTVNIGSAISGTIIRARVYVSAAWNANSTIDIGTVSSPSSVLANTVIDGSLVGQFFVGDISMAASSTQLKAAVTAAGTGGTATVMVEYIHA